MKNIVLFLVSATMAIAWFARPQSPVTPAGAPPDGPLSFRITFGERQEREADCSGSVTLGQGKIVKLSPWRFYGSDAVEGANGWKLRIKRGPLENQPDQPRAIASPGPSQNIVPAGIVVTAEAPQSSSVQVQSAAGNFEFRLAALSRGQVLWFQDGDVSVQRVPTPERIADPGPENDYPSLAVARDGSVWTAWQSYQDGGEHVVVRHSTPAGWSEPVTLTDKRGDVFRTTVEQDTEGRVWVVWSERTGESWDLWTRIFDGRQWRARRKLTASGVNIFHKLVKDRAGALHLIWIGHIDGRSHVMWSRLQGDSWSTPIEISGPSAWMPDAAADSKGNLYVVWDSYRTGNYDVFLRRIGASGNMGAIEQITRSPRFQAHASVAVDRQDRVWVAWDESGANWGKDWARDDTWRGTVLYSDRRPRVAVFENGTWKQPVADPMAAVPRRYNRFVQAPRLACDDQGRVWLGLQVRTSTAQNRSDFWAANGRWELFLTSLDGGRWTPAAPVPNSSTRPDGAVQLQRTAQGIRAVWMNDNRFFGGPAIASNRKVHQEIDTAQFTLPAPREAELETFAETPGNAAAIHKNEPADVARIRSYRAGSDSGSYRIVRGDFHRHTEISSDGAGDGSVEDYFRYMIDAAQMDTGIIADHSAGGDNEYTWWRTEKANDLFHIQSGFTPLFGYERSVPYPNGHRNIVFAERGVRTLPISREEQQGKVNTGPVLYPYLKQNRGICMLHSLATDQGSDYRDNDPEVEPLVEIYQGYHANYEYEGAPRAEATGYAVSSHGSVQPLGFYWNALAKGFKLGVESSSDHISTHTSYTMILASEPNRAGIVESMRKRHAYGATDNIILDFRAIDGKNRIWLMGDALESAAPPRMRVKVIGTGVIDRIDVIKDGKFVFENHPRRETGEFTWVDNAPGKGRSWYYVRVMQTDRQMAWSSPIWVDYSRR